MPIGASGGKNKSRQESIDNQTRTNTLSTRAAGMLTDGINDAKGMSYNRFDPASIDQYQSPYTQDVIDATVARADQGNAIDRNRQQSDFASAGAFGDDRRGIYEAELAGNQSRDRGELIAGLNDRAYGQARDVAQGENQNANQYDMMIQQLLAQLRGGFANEGTQTMTGTNLTKSKGTQFGATASWSPARGFN